VHAEIGDVVQSKDDARRRSTSAPRATRSPTTEASLTAAKARRTIAKTQLDRAESLHKSQTLTQADVEKAQLEFAQSDAQVVTATISLENARITLDDTDARAQLHFREVGHLHENRAAAHVRRRRGDHRALLGRPSSRTCPVMRAHVGVVQRDARVLERNRGGHTWASDCANSSCAFSTSACVSVCDLCNDSARSSLRLRDRAPAPCRGQRGLGVGDLVARGALVDLDEHRLGLHDVANLGGAR